MTMTPEAKKALPDAIRGLREHLLAALHSETWQVYRLTVVDIAEAGLDERARCRRQRLEDWISEQTRTQPGPKRRKAPVRDPEFERYLRDAEKEAAYTLLNRVIMLRLLEAAGLRRVPVVTGGWQSRGFQHFRELAPALVVGDRSEGYAALLQLVFEDLARTLPGLFDDHGIASLIHVPPETWRHLVETLDAPELASCWTDDMTLGWVYQYWNDPEREALDVKLHARGKLEPHEIASKTQMFTERYMVDWLLQNSLGPMWRAICARNEWTPAVVADGTLARLEDNRVKWRARREAGEVALTELMPLHDDAERRWAYYMDSPLPADAAEHAPRSVRDIKLLDPAVGSGHFLVVAFDLLFALYREEAAHRNATDDPRWSKRAIVERILEHNLHGVDIDPRAIQIAAAALWLKARTTCPEARPGRLNLVASKLRLASLPDDDPALEELRRAVERETGIPAELTDTVLHGLRHADHLGSLLRVDAAVEAALDRHERGFSRAAEHVTGDLFLGHPEQQRVLIDRATARKTILEQLDEFLNRHTHGDDLGLRLRGEQLAAGVRFVKIVRENCYDLVVGNPPYQGTAKMADAEYVQKTYEKGKADLYAAFLERGLQLVRPGGVSALLTMRNWMFIKQYASLRQELLKTYDLRALGDFDRGAFESVPDEVVSVVVSVFQRLHPRPTKSVALQPTPTDDRTRDSERTQRKRAATLAGVGRVEFSLEDLRSIKQRPLVYWWPEELLARYKRAVKIGEAMESRVGLRSSNNARFIRLAWEVPFTLIELCPLGETMTWAPDMRYVPHVMGAAGRSWIDNVSHVIDWARRGIDVCVALEVAYNAYPQSTEFYFQPAVALPKIGSNFSARAVTYRSVIDVAAPCVFPKDLAAVVCSLNRKETVLVLDGLNPTMNLQPGDIDRLPIWVDDRYTAIWDELLLAFAEHESHREPSVEFHRPGPSPWRHAQEWAQLAVDRPEGAPLPPYVAEHDPEPATDHLSYALGVALGRFGNAGEGILEPAKDSLAHALPAGILFLDTTLSPHDRSDGLGHAATDLLRAAWETHGAVIAPEESLRDYLASSFFDVHRKMYENRPIHWPLSSEKRTFVAWVTIHRWTGNTLLTLLADHLRRVTETRLDGELADLRVARVGADKKAARAADKRFIQVQKWRDELTAFINAVEQCAERGPPPSDPQCPAREVDAPYVPDLDDGVMINSAALWPLLAPQWKDPKKWWRELASAADKKHYDWAHLAMRYWPTRVDERCRQDPSLAVAHGCFWRYHPARAWAWELRLQDEIGPDFRLTEPAYRDDGGDAAHRAEFLVSKGEEALRLVQVELFRRIRKHGQPLSEYHLPETGLWTRHPDTCWKLESAVILKQKADFELLGEDEPGARFAYMNAYPDEVKRRDELLRIIALRDAMMPDAHEPADPEEEPVLEDSDEEHA